MYLTDAQNAGSDAHAYRLRISAAAAGFRAAHDAVQHQRCAPGRAVPVSVYAVRKDGFDGDIEVALKDAPAGFSLSRRAHSARPGLRAHDPDGAAQMPAGRTTALQFEGRAQIGGEPSPGRSSPPTT